MGAFVFYTPKSDDTAKVTISVTIKVVDIRFFCGRINIEAN